jgi:hypothetical protein
MTPYLSEVCLGQAFSQAIALLRKNWRRSLAANGLERNDDGDQSGDDAVFNCRRAGRILGQLDKQSPEEPRFCQEPSPLSSRAAQAYGRQLIVEYFCTS